MLTSHDNVIVTNESSKDLLWKLDGRGVGIPAGQSVHVPFDVVVNRLGDPRSGEQERVATDGNEKIRIPSRAQELKRLHIKWGVSAAQQVANQKGEDVSAITLQAAVPPVKVTTIAGDPIETVVSDPAGANPQTIPIALDTPDAVNARVAQMQRDLDSLMQTQKALEDQPVSDGEDVVEDNPGSLGQPPADT